MKTSPGLQCLGIALAAVMSTGAGATSTPVTSARASATGALPDYTFTQTGFSNGYLTGSFSGDDLNGDGYLMTGEVTDFQFSFFGTDGSSFESLAVPVDQMFDGGGGFGYKLGSKFLGDDPGEFVAAGLSKIYTAGFSYIASGSGGTFFSPPDFPIGETSSSKLIGHITPIPEPTTSALMLSGLLLLSVAWRRSLPPGGSHRRAR